MVAQQDWDGLHKAVQRYFDLMYDADTSRFDRVFSGSAQLHGVREGKITMWSAQTYKEVLESRDPPAALHAPREESILLVDLASPTQALVKVRVRINATVFVDYLTYHRQDGEWLITSKGYHVDAILPTEARA